MAETVRSQKQRTSRDLRGSMFPSTTLFQRSGSVGSGTFAGSIQKAVAFVRNTPAITPSSFSKSIQERLHLFIMCQLQSRILKMVAALSFKQMRGPLYRNASSRARRAAIFSTPTMPFKIADVKPLKLYIYIIGSITIWLTVFL